MSHKTICASCRAISVVAVIASILFYTSVLQPLEANTGKTDSLPAAASEVQKLAADKPELSTLEYREAKKIDIPVTDGMTGNWRAVAYEANVEELSDTDFPAKLCFYSDDEEATQHCFKGIAAKPTIRGTANLSGICRSLLFFGRSILGKGFRLFQCSMEAGVEHSV